MMKLVTILTVSAKVAVVVILTLGFSVPVQAAGESKQKIGTVSLRRIFEAYEVVQSSTEALKQEVEKNQKIIDDKKDEITRLTEELDKKEIVLSQAEKNKQEEMIDAKVKALQDLVIKINQSMRDMENQLKGDIIDKIVSTVETIGEQENFDLILEMNDKILLFSNPEYDITDKVLKNLN